MNTTNNDQYFEREMLPFEQIMIHKDFPNGRKAYLALDDLANSIRETGLQNPVMVWEVHSPKPVQLAWGTVNTYYILISGFRRYHAIQQIRIEHPDLFEHVPVHIFRGERKDAILLNLAENIQREDPNPVELGALFHELVETHKMPQGKIAVQVGKSDAYVSQILKFHTNTDIAPQLREWVETNQINVWLALLIAKQPVEKQIQIIERIKDAFANKVDPKFLTQIKNDLKNTKPQRQKKQRSRKEIQERFDKLLLSDLQALSEQDQMHVSGILKTLSWCLNNDVEWSDSSLSGWGLPENAFEDAQNRQK